MTKIIVIPIEPIDTRYTRQWYDTFPELLRQHAPAGTEIIQIDGEEVPPVATEGMFLDFCGTNIYKSSQLITIAKMFRNGEIAAGDKFIFTDFWNTSIIQIKYMSDLMGIPVEIHGLAHAGSYDPHDALAQLIPDKRWSNNTEKAMFHALDYIHFATVDHINMFKTNVFGAEALAQVLTQEEEDTKFVRTGWPMEYMSSTLQPYVQDKTNTIVFPHRVAPEKQPDIFRDLQKELPQYNFVICQELDLTKDEYHNILGEAKIVFSANLQETLGISAYEGALLNAIPILPNRLSYTEMYNDIFLYPSEWTLDYNNYQQYKEEIKALIVDRMDNYDNYIADVNQLKLDLESKFFSASNLLDTLFKS